MSPRLRGLRSLFAALAFVVLATSSVFAQTDARNNASAETTNTRNTSAAKPTAVNPKYTTPKSALDTAYGAKIAEYTTEKYFMTELVDHLPLSDKVPSPEKVGRTAKL